MTLNVPQEILNHSRSKSYEMEQVRIQQIEEMNRQEKLKHSDELFFSICSRNARSSQPAVPVPSAIPASETSRKEEQDALFKEAVADGMAAGLLFFLILIAMTLFMVF